MLRGGRAEGVKLFCLQPLAASKMNHLTLPRCRAVFPMGRRISSHAIPEKIYQVNRGFRYRQEQSKNISVLRVIGTGASGSASSVLLEHGGSRYLFNCGDGIHRQLKTAYVGKNSVERIFLTSLTSKNISGLSDFVLSAEERIRNPELSIHIHGPKGADLLLAEDHSFVKVENIKVEYKDCDPGKPVFLPSLAVHPVVLRMKKKTPCSKILGPEWNMSSPTKMNFYNYSRKVDVTKPCVPSSTAPEEVESDVSVAYICHLECLPPTRSVDTEKHVSFGTGENDHHTAVIVVDCASESYLYSLISSESFKKYLPEGVKHITIVHFTPSAIMKDDRYLKWMRSFPQNTKHLVVNDINDCFGYGHIMQRQHLMGRLNPLLFPQLSGVNLRYKEGRGEGMHQTLQVSPACVSEAVSKDNCLENEFENASAEWHARWGSDVSDLHLLESRYLTEIDLSSNMLNRNKEQWWSNSATKMMFKLIPGSETVIDNYHARVSKELGMDLKQTAEEREGEIMYPQIVFLGTSSKTSTAYRNCSGILLRISEDKCLLMDCGEGTLMQLQALYSQAELHKILCSLRAVYISHPHADHHHGLTRFLRAHSDALAAAGNQSQTLILLVPQPLTRWLSVWHNFYEECLQHVKLVCLHKIELGREGLQVKNVDDMFMKELDMELICTCAVKHCSFSYGVTFLHKDGWKITYSGDTKFCDTLAQMGLDSDVLIHEATYGIAQSEVARRTLHSNVADAIRCGEQMRAKFVILTHFQSRHLHLPVMSEIQEPNVGVAFDFMTVSLEDLPSLPLLNETLEELFVYRMPHLTQREHRHSVNKY